MDFILDEQRYIMHRTAGTMSVLPIAAEFVNGGVLGNSRRWRRSKWHNRAATAPPME